MSINRKPTARMLLLCVVVGGLAAPALAADVTIEGGDINLRGRTASNSNIINVAGDGGTSVVGIASIQAIVGDLDVSGPVTLNGGLTSGSTITSVAKDGATSVVNVASIQSPYSGNYTVSGPVDLSATFTGTVTQVVTGPTNTSVTNIGGIVVHH
jgi:hypothetical protein